MEFRSKLNLAGLGRSVLELAVSFGGEFNRGSGFERVRRRKGFRWV